MKEQQLDTLKSGEHETFNRNKLNMNQTALITEGSRPTGLGVLECFDDNKENECENRNNIPGLMFCSDCQDVYCSQVGQLHENHGTSSVDAACETLKGLLNSEVMKVRCLIRYSNIVVKDLRSYLENCASHLADITEKIFERAKSMPSGSEVLVESTLNEIQTENDAERNRITAKVKEFEEFIATTKSTSIACENVLSELDEQNFLVKGYNFLKSSAQLRKSLPVSPLERRLYMLTPVFEKQDGQELSPEEQLGEFIKASVPWRIEVKRLESLRPEAVASSRFVTTMCPAKDEHIWVVWQWGPKVHLVDKMGNVKHTIDAGVKVDDICIDYDGNLVVSSHEAKCIKVFDDNFEVLKTIQVDKVPRGIDFTSKNELVMCCVQNLHHRNGDVNELKRICTDKTSDAESTIGADEGLMQPWRVAVNINGDICVSDRNAGNVKIFNSQGAIKSVYNGPDASTRHPFAPHAITCDNHGQLFVVDYANHTVHVLDPLGRFRGFLIMDTELDKRAIFMGTSSPFSITIDSVGDLWVGNKFGYLTVLKHSL